MPVPEPTDPFDDGARGCGGDRVDGVLCRSRQRSRVVEVAVVALTDHGDDAVGGTRPADARRSSPAPAPSYARPTAMVLESAIGVSITPHSRDRERAGELTGSVEHRGAGSHRRVEHASSVSGTMTVTPVRATCGSSCHTVECPTRTPGTSTMPFVAPVGSVPITTPRSRGTRAGCGRRGVGHRRRA